MNVPIKKENEQGKLEGKSNLQQDLQLYIFPIRSPLEWLCRSSAMGYFATEFSKLEPHQETTYLSQHLFINKREIFFSTSHKYTMSLVCRFAAMGVFWCK